jgi:DNA polymerase elongation subunit (family B)
LRRETGLPISVEYDFKYLVLLPLQADVKIEALKQYYGITHDGQLVVRGIEIRRHDTPKFIKEFQTELLSTLFDCENVVGVMNKGYENALLKNPRRVLPADGSVSIPINFRIGFFRCCQTDRGRRYA